jgi:hypothetical protein
MKALVVLAAAVTLAAACAASAPRAQEPQRPVLVIVHGRGHGDADSAALRRRWKRALDSALAPNGARLADGDLRLAWYADILDPSGQEACERTADADSATVVVRGIFGAMAALLPNDQETRETRGLIGDLLWVIDDARRCAAERRVGAEIERAIHTRRPVVVIGYSLGSVVTYGYLRARAPRAGDPPIDLITVGSPLGHPVFRELLGVGPEALRRPRSVRSWENVYDPNDPFASPITDATAADVLSNRATENETSRDPHDIERYLGDRATSAILKRLFAP